MTTPWHDPVIIPPPQGKPVLVRLRSGRITAGVKIDGMWKIDGRMMPGSTVLRWTEIPPDGEYDGRKIDSYQNA
jgi:hypothetical protein